MITLARDVVLHCPLRAACSQLIDAEHQQRLGKGEDWPSTADLICAVGALIV